MEKKALFSTYREKALSSIINFKKGVTNFRCKQNKLRSPAQPSDRNSIRV